MSAGDVVIGYRKVVMMGILTTVLGVIPLYFENQSRIGGAICIDVAICDIDTAVFIRRIYQKALCSQCLHRNMKTGTFFALFVNRKRTSYG